MDRRLIIIGAGGHGKVVADTAMRIGYTEISFVDDGVMGECMGLPIIGTTEILKDLNDGRTDFVIGVGNNQIRKRIAESHPVNWVTLIHPSAQIGSHVTIGTGTVVMAGVVINACAQIGEHCIINTSAVIEHDNILEDYVHISPRAVLGGTVHIGGLTHVGIGATVKNNTHICEGCTIGAGAVVVKDITESDVYVGIPAKKMGR